MNVSVLEAGFLWRVRVLQGPAARRETIMSASRFVRGAGEIGKPSAVSLMVTPMSIPQIQTIISSLSFDSRLPQAGKYQKRPAEGEKRVEHHGVEQTRDSGSR
jgi:hypothetical protein